MKKLSNKEIKLLQFLDKNVGDEYDKKSAIKYLKDYLGFTPEEVLKYYSLWYYSSGSDYETYEYDEEGELIDFINTISTLSSEQIEEITDFFYDSGKLDKILGNFFNANCGGWRSTTPCITFEAGGITVELDRDNWRDYFSGLGDDDLWMYDNAFSSYSDFYEEVMDEEFDYVYHNDETIKYLETIAILAGQNSWPGKNNERIGEGDIKDFLNETLPPRNVENIVDNYISEVSVELTRVRLEAVRYCYNNESEYNTNETRCNSGDYCIFISYEDLKEFIINNNMLNLSELKDVKVNGEIDLHNCYYDAWIDDEGVNSCIKELNRSLEREIERISEDDDLDLEQLIEDRKELFNMLDKFGFIKYTSTTSGGYYKSEDGKIDLHTDGVNFKEKKIKFTYEGKPHIVPFEEFPNWVSGSVLDLNESVKINKKLLKEQKKNITKISIFDFDGTLMDTPHPEEGKKEWEKFTGKKYPHKGWWSKPESLDDAVFDIQPINTTVSDYKKEMGNPNTMVIMLTGRLPHQSEQIEELLSLHNINFDEYHYKSNGDTLTSKKNTIKTLLHRYPYVSKIEMWEDREPHALSFKQWGEDNGINITVNLVGGKSSNPINENIDPEEKYVNKLSGILTLPYFYNLIQTETPESLWNRILSKVFNQEVEVSGKDIYDSNGNLIYYEESDGFWVKREYDSNNKLIYREDSNGFWEKYEYDLNGKKIYSEDSDGDWIKQEYDSYGNLIYRENSDGEIRDRRPINENIDPEEKYINKMSGILTLPYFYNLKLTETPESLWNRILSKIFNQEVTYRNYSSDSSIYNKYNEIYYEHSNGFWEKYEYDSNGRLNYREDSDGIIIDKRPINENIDPEEKYINKLSSILKPPYVRNLKLTETPTYLWNKILSKIFNQEVRRSDNSIYDSYNSIYDSYGNKIYSENSDGFWKYDSNGNVIYLEYSYGYWEKYEYDSNNNLIYSENSNGFWEKREYDSNGNLIYRENSNGEIRDRRPINENIDPEEKYINKMSGILTLPYFYNLKLTDTPENLWNRILSKIFNQEVTYSDNGTYRFLTVEEPTEWFVVDEDDRLLYAEDKSGFWTQQKYNDVGKLIYQIDSNHSENRVVPMDNW